MLVEMYTEELREHPAAETKSNVDDVSRRWRRVSTDSAFSRRSEKKATLGRGSFKGQGVAADSDSLEEDDSDSDGETVVKPGARGYGWNKVFQVPTGTQLTAIQMEMQRMAEEVADHVIPKTKAQERLLAILDSMTFTLLVGCVIACNSVLVGMRNHCEVKYVLGQHGDEQLTADWWAGWNWWFDVSEAAIIWFFIAEWCLRILAERKDFLFGVNRRWNWFETLIVMGSIIEMFGYTSRGVSSLRVFRILRAVRIIKLFTFLSHLRLMLFSMVSCAIPLLWALVLLALTMYCFAVWLSHAIFSEVQGDPSILTVVLDSGNTVGDVLQDNWDGILISIRTLIYSVTGGLDWGEAAEPFWRMSVLYGVSYLVFVTAMLLGLLNVMVGVFVQESANVLMLDRELVLDQGVQSGEASRMLLAELFIELDKDGSHSLTEQEIHEGLQEPRIKAFFKHIGIDMNTKATHLFALIDTENNGEVSMKQFVDGCMQFQGSARPIDVAALGRQLEKQLLRLEESVTALMPVRNKLLAQNQ